MAAVPAEHQEQQGAVRLRPAPPPLYRSTAGEQEVRRLYDKALAALPYPHEELLVSTSFGTAHVVVCGPADAPPLVVWHGMSAPAPFMLRFFDPLLLGDGPRFRVYCADIPYHAGSRSEDAELDPAKNEHGRWCLEVLQGLALVGPAAGHTEPPPFHVGVSFGAAVILDLAVVAPETIRGAGLVVPGGIVPIEPWPVLFKLMLPMALFRLVPCRWTSWLACYAMCDNPADVMGGIIELSWRHVMGRVELPGGNAGFTHDQLRGFSAPTLLIAAEHDIFWPGHAAAAAAKLSLPGCRTIVMPGARHLPGRARITELNGWLSDFFAEVAAAQAGTSKDEGSREERGTGG